MADWKNENCFSLKVLRMNLIIQSVYGGKIASSAQTKTPHAQLKHSCCYLVHYIVLTIALKVNCQFIQLNSTDNLFRQ